MSLYLFAHENRFDEFKSICATCANNDPRFRWVYIDTPDVLQIPAREPGQPNRVDYYDHDASYVNANKSLEYKQMITKLMDPARDPEWYHGVHDEQVRAFLASKKEEKEYELPRICVDTSQLVNKHDFPEIEFYKEDVFYRVIPFHCNPRYQLCVYPIEHPWMFVIDVKTMEIKSGARTPAQNDEYDPEWTVYKTYMYYGDIGDDYVFWLNYDEQCVHQRLVDYAHKMRKEVKNKTRTILI